MIAEYFILYALLASLNMKNSFCYHFAKNFFNDGCACSGYMSPEYAMHGQFSVKSDVYSFGVLVLEIISGQKIIASVKERMWKIF